MGAIQPTMALTGVNVQVCPSTDGAQASKAALLQEYSPFGVTSIILSFPLSTGPPRPTETVDVL